MLGGLLATVLALRIIFVSGGILLLIALVPVALLVREPRWADSRRERVSMRQAISQAAPGTVLTIVVLSASLGLAFLSVTGMQQLMVLRILSFHPALAALATGITFTAFGIATAFAATFYSRLVGKWGFRGIAILSAGLLSCAIAASAVVPNVSLLVSCAAFAGLAYGALFPTLNSMLGLEAPARIRATVFGFAASLTSFGNGLGPLLGGTIAAIAGVRWALFAIAIAALVAAALVGVWGRQPVPDA
jgi:DHA1 family multidrug resistance protein-like MFS transporter